jgi:hypothetical protein
LALLPGLGVLLVEDPPGLLALGRSVGERIMIPSPTLRVDERSVTERAL